MAIPAGNKFIMPPRRRTKPESTEAVQAQQRESNKASVEKVEPAKSDA